MVAATRVSATPPPFKLSRSKLLQRIELVYHFAHKRLKPIYSAKHVKHKPPLEVYAYRSQVNSYYHEKHPRCGGYISW